MGSGGDNGSCKTCKAPVTSSPPTKQHLPFYRQDALPIAQPFHSTEDEISHSMDLLTLSSPGVWTYLCPVKAADYFGERVAKTMQSRK